jgi:hypothetical protein
MGPRVFAPADVPVFLEKMHRSNTIQDWPPLTGLVEKMSGLRENSISSQGTALRAAEKSCFVSGHDFIRALKDG